MRKLFTIVLGLALACIVCAQTPQAAGTLTVAALNVDGMPKSVKILGIADLNLNPDAKEGPGATAIGNKLREMGWDIVAVSEDFNYHTELLTAAHNNGQGVHYSATTHGGIIETSAAAYTNFIAQRTVFDTDGLCLFYRNDKGIIPSGEQLVGWTDKSGFTDNGADKMINKGYRYYCVTMADGFAVDVYIVHMDAECDTGSQNARRSNIAQVVAAIKASHNGRPIIIMGDTNCRYNRDQLKSVGIDALNADSRFVARDAWVECERGSIYPTYVAEADASASLMVNLLGYQKGEVVDKVIYINNSESEYYIAANYFRQEMTFVNEYGEPVADHWPVSVQFSYYRKAGQVGTYTDPVGVHNPVEQPNDTYYWMSMQGNGTNEYWANDTKHYETYLDNGSFTEGDIMVYQYRGLPAGRYKVRFEAVVNSANGVTNDEGDGMCEVFVNNISKPTSVILQNSCTPSIYEHEFIATTATDGVLRFGIRAIGNGGGNWAVVRTIGIEPTSEEEGFVEKWIGEAAAPGTYYIYNIGQGTWLQADNTQTKDAMQATAWTLTADGNNYQISSGSGWIRTYYTGTLSKTYYSVTNYTSPVPMTLQESSSANAKGQVYQLRSVQDNNYYFACNENSFSAAKSSKDQDICKFLLIGTSQMNTYRTLHSVATGIPNTKENNIRKVLVNGHVWVVGERVWRL